MTRLSEILRLALSIIACQAAGIIGSVFTSKSVGTWYLTLRKPVFTPPSWVFAPVWITLYVLMGISAFLIWSKGLDTHLAKLGLGLFGVQLILNALWSVAFFGLRSPLAGLIVILALSVAILLTMTIFFRMSLAAGLLLVPYMGWVGFAAALNLAIFVLNR
jgi:benzodiazapine receptor